MRADAEAQGETVIDNNPAVETFGASGKLPPSLIPKATAGMRVMQEEILGALLPIIDYVDVGMAIAQVEQQVLRLRYIGLAAAPPCGIIF